MKITVETPVSFMTPTWLAEATAKYHNRSIDLSELAEQQRHAIDELIGCQRAHGLEWITDGALHCVDGFTDFWSELEGVAARIVLSGRVYQDQYSGDASLSLTGRIGYNDSHPCFKQLEFLLLQAGNVSGVRFDIPAPAYFLLTALKLGWHNSPVYNGGALLMARDIAEAWRATISKLKDLGCKRLLLNDRSWASLCSADSLKRMLQGGIDAQAVARMLRDCNEQALEGIDDLEVILYTPAHITAYEMAASIVAAEIFGHSNVTGYMVDVLNRADLMVLKSQLSHLKPHNNLILGLVNPKQPQLEDADDLAAIIDTVGEALNNPERLGISTAGGFRQGNSDFTAFTPDDQWRKIDLLQSLAIS